MKTLFLAGLICLCHNVLYSQSDSLFVSVFVVPVEDILIEEEDSLTVIEAPLLLNGSNQEFEYTFYISGLDTLNVDSINVEFISAGEESITEDFSYFQIENDLTIERIGNSVFLPFGNYPFYESYSFSVTLKDENGIIIQSASDSFSND